MSKLAGVVLGLSVVGACATEEVVPVRVTMSPSGAASRVAAVTDGVCPPDQTCVTPTELSVKITAAYVAEDVAAGTGNNVGATQAAYASPECEGIGGADDASVQPQPNLGNCSIDVGLMSSSSPPQRIISSPRYLDLAAGKPAVEAALDAGKFGVAPGTYRYLRMDSGSNSPMGQFNGNQDVSPAGTAMNFRFMAEGMSAPYEIRRLVGVDVAFPAPLELTTAQQVDVDIEYSIVNTVYVVSMGSGMPNEDLACTPFQGTPAKRYCLDVSKLQFTPVLTVTDL